MKLPAMSNEECAVKVYLYGALQHSPWAGGDNLSIVREVTKR